MKPSIPQGTRDFAAPVIRKRNYIFNTIRTVFELYGFEPLETPAMENLETLTGKYGDEGDKLIYPIRSNKNILKSYSEQKEEIKEVLKKATGIEYTFLPHKSDKALRYDLTIPLARFVAMNYNSLTFPFKRYQIQPVWRGDRPQKGRYREFYQCDADVVGSHSLLNEIELLNAYYDVFKKLGIEISIKINNRKILYGLFEELGVQIKEKQILIAIDKFDKIGLDKVQEELLKEIEDQLLVDKLQFTLLMTGGNNAIKLNNLKSIILASNIGKQGIKEVEYVLDNISEPLKDIVEFDTTLARGLDYYTGVIIEVKAKNVSMGSIGGGGRYDDLTGLFGVPGIPGVGISFGVDRIYDVMEELHLFPETMQTGVTALFFNMGEKESKFAFEQMQKLRAGGISCELFHEPAKMDKQFKYAAKKNIGYAVIIGSKEIENGNCVVKDLGKNEQQVIPLYDLGKYFRP